MYKLIKYNTNLYCVKSGKKICISHINMTLARKNSIFSFFLSLLASKSGGSFTINNHKLSGTEINMNFFNNHNIK